MFNTFYIKPLHDLDASSALLKWRPKPFTRTFSAVMAPT